MAQLKVKDLFELCANEIRAGNGNKNIVISDDIEGNGFHGLFCGFSPIEGLEEIYDSVTTSANDTIILG